MKGNRILLVEDDKLQAKITREYLESAGYEVILADNGKTAIKSVKTGSVDLVILDLILPDMNGNEVCRWLKLNEDTRGIPIIMLTAKGSTMDKVQGLHAGADDYLLKPYNETELNARIYASLRTKALQDELREKNRQLEEVLSKVEVLASTDPLTGLYNRRHFEKIMEIEFAKTIRYNSPISCIMVDVDHFKKINDTYGHRTGDIVLKEVTRIIQDCIRKVDTAARWGGEEFVALLPRTGKEQAFYAASRIWESIAGYPFPTIETQITVSIGIASVPDPSIDSAEKLIDASDIAMYRAKTLGRNRIETAS
ncbi:MAG: diguanylate cyclase [Thermodesulfovibrionales bacterium]|nr:diguanylate cyclase [Thermodesulfovibrionales bacterium]